MTLGWLALAATAIVADERSIERGAAVYRIYCRGCHGDGATGDGPTAERLTPHPTDLTRLAGDRGGTFPREPVMREIDGREKIPAHPRPIMPIWGLAFQQFDTDVDQESEVRERLADLADYLESIQRRPPG